MVVVCINPLRTLDDVLSPNMSKILNEPGRIVLILDPTLKSDMFILNNEYRKSLELSGLLQNASEGTVGDHPSEAPDLVPLDAPAGFLPATQDGLTRRQRDVLYLIVQGRTNKEIARSLGLGEGTVKIHVAALFGKLGVHHRAAVAVAGTRFLSEPGTSPIMTSGGNSSSSVVAEPRPLIGGMKLCAHEQIVSPPALRCVQHFGNDKARNRPLAAQARPEPPSGEGCGFDSAA